MENHIDSEKTSFTVVGVVGVVALLALLALVFLMYGQSVGLDKVL